MGDQKYPPGGAELPLRFDMKFRPWRYGLSHSELELRSFDRGEDRQFVAIRFYSVFAVQMGTVYSPLTIDEADADGREVLRRLAGVDEERWRRARCVVLRSERVEGLVACASFSIRCYPNGFPRR